MLHPSQGFSHVPPPGPLLPPRVVQHMIDDALRDSVHVEAAVLGLTPSEASGPSAMGANGVLPCAVLQCPATQTSFIACDANVCVAADGGLRFRSPHSNEFVAAGHASLAAGWVAAVPRRASVATIRRGEVSGVATKHEHVAPTGDLRELEQLANERFQQYVACTFDSASVAESQLASVFVADGGERGFNVVVWIRVAAGDALWLARHAVNVDPKGDRSLYSVTSTVVARTPCVGAGSASSVLSCETSEWLTGSDIPRHVANVGACVMAAEDHLQSEVERRAIPRALGTLAATIRSRDTDSATRSALCAAAAELRKSSLLERRTIETREYEEGGKVAVVERRPHRTAAA